MKKRIAVILEEELLRKVEEKAKGDHRSRNAWIVRALAQMVVDKEAR